MDATEFGAYMSLIIACYQCGNKLPKDDKRLARMARVSTHKWSKIKGTILEKFEEKNDFYEQIFVKKDLQRMKSLSEKNKANRLNSLNTARPVVNQSSDQTATNTNNKDLISNNNIDRGAKTPSRPKGTRINSDWVLPEEWGEWAEDEGHSYLEICKQEELFKDYWLGVAGQKGVKLDWEATWRNWMRRAKEFER